MRNTTLVGLVLLMAGGPVSPAAAQDGSEEPPAVKYRSLMPLQVDIEKFTLVGSSEFAPGDDESNSVHGWSDHDFDTVAIMPLDNMAACSDLTVTYTSGEVEDFPLLRPGLLSHKQIYQVVLRGEPSDVEAIAANCHALSGDGVTIGFYGATGDLF